VYDIMPMPSAHELLPDDDNDDGEPPPEPSAKEQQHQEEEKEEGNEEEKDGDTEDNIEEDESTRKPRAVSSFGRHVQQQQEDQQQKEISPGGEQISPLPPPTDYSGVAKKGRPSIVPTPPSSSADAIGSSEFDDPPPPFLRASSQKGNNELNIPIRTSSSILFCAITTVPGAVAVGDFNNNQQLETLGDNLDDTPPNDDTYLSRPDGRFDVDDRVESLDDSFHDIYPRGLRDSRAIEAHLVPDDDDAHDRLLNDDDIIVATEVKAVPSSSSSSSSSYCCGLKRYTFAVLVVFIAIVAGGIVGGFLSSVSSNKKDKEDESKARSPMVAPIIPINDPLVDELREWIVPTEQDLIPFSNPTSAQFQALEWLRSDPIAMSDERSTQTVLERYVLTVFYYATLGPNWFRSYLSEEDVCSWNWGVNDTLSGVYCLEHSQTVDFIVLNWNNLRGTLPWELSLLTNLMEINLDNNSIGGTIPSRHGSGRTSRGDAGAGNRRELRPNTPYDGRYHGRETNS